MVSRVSSTGGNLQNMLNMQRNKANFELLSYRISSGKKFEHLRDYGINVPRIINLRNEMASSDSYIRSIDLSKTFIDSYQSSLKRMAEIAKKLIASADTLTMSGDSWPSTNNTMANNMLLETESELSLEIGGRFIYAGSNYKTSPVGDLRLLNTYATSEIGIPNIIQTTDTIPQMIHSSGPPILTQSYHSGFNGANTIDVNAFKEASININNGQSIKYGISATNEAFQNLIEGIMRFKSATKNGLTLTERTNFVNEAKKLAHKARLQIRELQATNAITGETMNNTKKAHKSFIHVSISALNGIEKDDAAVSAARISTLQIQIQSSYAVIAKRHKLSLINFL